MQEFLETEWGKMVNKVTGEVEYPPGNRTNWDGEVRAMYSRSSCAS